MSSRGPLVVVTTHPIQYHVPVYRAVAERFGVPLRMVFGSDFSIAGYYDREFQASFAWDSGLLDPEDGSSVFLSRVRDKGPGSYETVTAAGLDEALRELQPGAILLNGYASRFDRQALWAALRTGRPLLFRGETTDHARRRPWLQGWARRQGLRWLYRRFARLLPIGQRSYQHYRALGLPAERLILAPYCVHTAPFACDERARQQLREAARARLGLKETDWVTLFSGKLSRRKGVHVLIEAARRLPGVLRERWVGLFLGAGQERETLEARAAAAPAVRTQFLGFQNQTQLSPYYHAADLLALPSLEMETWGLVVNEALHHGLPAVVSDAVGCAPDLVEPGGTGEIAEAGSAEDLARALAAVHLRGREERVREACRARVAAYTVERAAEGIAQAYAQVAA